MFADRIQNTENRKLIFVGYGILYRFGSMPRTGKALNWNRNNKNAIENYTIYY